VPVTSTTQQGRTATLTPPWPSSTEELLITTTAPHRKTARTDTAGARLHPERSAARRGEQQPALPSLPHPCHPPAVAVAAPAAAQRARLLATRVATARRAARALCGACLPQICVKEARARRKVGLENVTEGIISAIRAMQ